MQQSIMFLRITVIYELFESASKFSVLCSKDFLVYEILDVVARSRFYRIFGVFNSLKKYITARIILLFLYSEIAPQ